MHLTRHRGSTHPVLNTTKQWITTICLVLCISGPLLAGPPGPLMELRVLADDLESLGTSALPQDRDTARSNRAGVVAAGGDEGGGDGRRPLANDLNTTRSNRRAHGHGTVAASGDEGGSPPIMNKGELIDAIAKDAGLTKADAGNALNAFISATADALKKGDRVQLIGLGSFSISRRAVRTSNEPDGSTEINIVDFVDERGEFSASHPRFDTVDDRFLVQDIAAVLQKPHHDRASKASDDDGMFKLAQVVVDSFVSNVADAISHDEWVDIEGFGTFYLVQETPQTGADIQIAAKKVAKFKAGKALADSVK